MSHTLEAVLYDSTAIHVSVQHPLELPSDRVNRPHSRELT